MKIKQLTPQFSLEPHLQQSCLCAVAFECTPFLRGCSFSAKSQLILDKTKQITAQILSVKNNKRLFKLQDNISPKAS